VDVELVVDVAPPLEDVVVVVVVEPEPVVLVATVVVVVVVVLAVVETVVDVDPHERKLPLSLPFEPFPWLSSQLPWP
jgi:hypothetical protein